MKGCGGGKRKLMCVANIGISSHSNLTLDMENIREPLSACYRVINENSLFTAAPKNQILVKHPVEGVVSSQDGLGRMARDGIHPPCMRCGLKGQERGLVNMTKGLLACSLRLRMKVNERQIRLFGWT